MQSRIVVVVLTITLRATLALGTHVGDVATETLRPGEHEEPGVVHVGVKLTNLTDLLTPVESVHVTIEPSGYADHRKGAFLVRPYQAHVVDLLPWTCHPGMRETCTAWITCSSDSNHANDTDVVIVSASGISGRAEMEPYAGMGLTLTPSPLVGNVLHVEYSLAQTGPASVSFFDIAGRPVLKSDFAGDRRGELPLDLRSLSGGVYLVRLDDGRSAVTQKLVVQR
jgi:hypothetical protein